MSGQEGASRLGAVTRVGWGVVRPSAPRGAYAQVGALRVPATFELIYLEHHPQTGELVFDIALGYEVDDGELRLRVVSSSTHEVDEALAKLTDEQGPLDQQKRRALMLLAADETDGASDSISHVVRTAGRTPTRRARNRLTEGLLREVVQVYRDAWENELPPTKAVADHFDRPHSTAARWVGEARRRGLLAPSDSSRGGEVGDSSSE